ncbi:hypothetical protein JT305_21415 [Salmonella enterica subsp. enterica serovar Senftenberg]|nr:hypothetical protein [Salmonella enterica subsp. enterica serovar Senftenberg]
MGYIGDSHFTGTAPFTGIDIQIPASLQHVEMLFIVVLASHDWQYTP